MRVLLFSVGDELFASPLASIEETIDRPLVRPMPGSDEHAVGVVDVRGRRIAAYSPGAALNVGLAEAPGAGLIIGSGAAAAILLISDVDDVVEIDPTAIRTAPGSEDQDGVLLGVFSHEGRLVSIVDPLAIREVTLSAASQR